MIDLRSDTVTKPTSKMREEMTQAKVGDDVYGEDPTVNKLQKEAAEKFGKDSALFVPSGTMGNQIAINIHTNPSDEVILDSKSHIYNYEIGTMAKFSGVMPRPIETDKKHLPIPKIEEAVRPEKYYLSRTGLIAIENTNNMRGGVIYPKGKKEELVKFAGERNIPVHLDGARIFNVVVESGKSVDKVVEGFDSVMFCLSKGLGAPIGSMLVGNEEFIEKARRVRKQLGGGMRQVGILAKAGLFALNNHIKRLKEDHRNAEILADELMDIEEIGVTFPETNIVIVDLTSSEFSASDLIDKLEEKDVLVGSVGPQRLRFVTHLGISKKDVRKAGEIIKSVF